MDIEKDAKIILGLFDTQQVKSLNIQMEKILLFIKKIVHKKNILEPICVA